MRYALSEGVRILPTPLKKAICPLCKSEVLAKCGKIKIWHWAHINLEDCDSFGELESEWHLNWKSLFPQEMVEVLIKRCDCQTCGHAWKKGWMYDIEDLCKHNHDGYECDVKTHRADILNNQGKVIELQNSRLSIDQIYEREQFYGNMIWILNQRTFAKNLIIRKSDRGDFYTFRWKWFPKTWSNAKKDIYIDYGHSIFHIKKIYPEGKVGGWGIWKNKDKFIEDLRSNIWNWKK